jgi:hypothetical protein
MSESDKPNTESSQKKDGGKSPLWEAPWLQSILFALYALAVSVASIAVCVDSKSYTAGIIVFSVGFLAAWFFYWVYFWETSGLDQMSRTGLTWKAGPHKEDLQRAYDELMNRFAMHRRGCIKESQASCRAARIFAVLIPTLSALITFLSASDEMLKGFLAPEGAGRFLPLWVPLLSLVLTFVSIVYGVISPAHRYRVFSDALIRLHDLEYRMHIELWKLDRDHPDSPKDGEAGVPAPIQPTGPTPGGNHAEPRPDYHELVLKQLNDTNDELTVLGAKLLDAWAPGPAKKGDQVVSSAG